MVRYFETLGTSLTIGSASGLGYLALNYPPAFRVLAIVAVGLSTFVVCCVLIWNQSNKFTYSAVAPFVSQSKARDALTAVSSKRVSLAQILGIYLLINIYLSLLFLLPWLIKLKS